MTKYKTMIKRIIAFIMVFLISFSALVVPASASAVNDTGYYYYDAYGFYKHNTLVTFSESNYLIDNSFIATRGGLRQFVNFITLDPDGEPKGSYHDNCFAGNKKIVFSFLDNNNVFKWVACSADTNFKLYYDSAVHKAVCSGILPESYYVFSFSSSAFRSSTLSLDGYKWSLAYASNNSNTNRVRSFTVSNVYQFTYSYYDIYNLSDGSLYEESTEDDSPSGLISAPDDSSYSDFPSGSDDSTVFSDDSSPTDVPPQQGVTETDTQYNGDLIEWLGHIVHTWLQSIYNLLVHLYNNSIAFFANVRSYIITLSQNFSIALVNSTNKIATYLNNIISRMNYIGDRIIVAIHQLNNTDINQTDRIVQALGTLQTTVDNSINNQSSSATYNIDLSSTNTKIDTTNTKLDTLNTNISSLSDLFRPSDGSSPATNIWDFLSTVASTLGGMVSDLANTASNIMTALLHVIETALEGLIDLLESMIERLFVPDTDNLHDIIEEEAPVIGQFSSLRNAFASASASDIQAQPISVPLTGVPSSQMVQTINADGTTSTSDTINLVFDLSTVPDSIKTPLYRMSTIILYVIQVFIVIRAFFKAFGVNITGGADE